MSSSLLIILLVVVWLLVLLPMVVNTKEPIRRTSAAFSATRVLHRGDDQQLKLRRHISPRPVDDEETATAETPALGEKTRRRSARKHAKRLTVDPAIISADSTTTNDTVESSERISTVAAKTSPEVIQATIPFADDIFVSDVRAVVSDAPTEEIIITPELLQESLDNYEAEIDTVIVMDAEIAPGAEATESVETENSGMEKANRTADANADIDTPVDVDAEGDVTAATGTSPVSRLSDTLAAKISSFTKKDRNIPEPAPQLTLTADDIAEAECRRGRGGYDPVAAEAAAQKRYKRRRVIFLVLAVLLIPMIAAAAVLGGLVWIAPTAWCGVIAFYLAALRSQVRLEKELRQRRLAQMRRARAQRAEYGYREEEETLASSFRGHYSLVDVDDGDPLFDHLETRPFMEEYMATHAEEFSCDDGGYMRDRFGRVRINAFRYPDATAHREPEYMYDGAEAAYQYDDPYAVGDYSGGRSVDYWNAREAADNVVRFDLSRRGGYRDVG